MNDTNDYFDADASPTSMPLTLRQAADRFGLSALAGVGRSGERRTP